MDERENEMRLDEMRGTERAKEGGQSAWIMVTVAEVGPRKTRKGRRLVMSPALCHSRVWTYIPMCTGLKYIGKQCRGTQNNNKRWIAAQGQIGAKRNSNNIKVELDGPNKPLRIEIGCE